MDKAIGRPVVQIQGSVSAKNYIDYNGLNLVGKYVYIQLAMLKEVATLHIELVNSSDVPLRITLSTLYANDKPRFLGASLRLPLPFKTGWTVLVLDMDQIIQRYCSGNVTRTTLLKLKHIKRVQLCSNMCVRDVVTSDKIITPDLKSIPRELAVKLLPGVDVIWYNVVDMNPSLAISPDQNIDIAKFITSNPTPFKMESSFSNIIESKETPTTELDMVDKTKDELPRRPLSAPGVAYPRSPHAVGTSPYMNNSFVVNDDPTPVKSFSNENNSSPANLTTTPRRTPISTPATARSNSNSNSNNQEIAGRADRVLAPERVMGYSGGPSAILYDGKMVVIASGNVIVLIDVEGEASKYRDTEQSPGLWRFFKQTQLDDEKYKQTFIRGHSSPIGLVEVSQNYNYMATCETGGDAQIFIWDLNEGKRVAILRPHKESIVAVTFSDDCSMFGTVGLDQQRRVQILAWDLQMLLMERGVVQPNAVVSAKDAGNACTTSNGLILGRQISDFHISKIKFSPFEDFGLVSCGRENIRFWRMRKGHMPGRPVLLNEHSRGFIFNDIAFYNEPGMAPKDPRRHCAYVSSNKGLLLKIDCQKEQVMCTYQLHSGSIRSLALRSGYAVTGGDDSKLRVWPLDFSDFLLEAHHENAVTSIHTSKNGRKLSIGTASGTLGILDVSEHSYYTILRSHVGAVLSIATRGKNGEEFVTVGNDGTIRLWDIISGQQKFEFSSPIDSPQCVVYHPSIHVISCGFASGSLRIFDVESTTTIVEKKEHAAPISAILYSKTDDHLRLFTGGLDGILTAYDALRGYETLKKLNFNPGPVDSVRMCISPDGTRLAISGSIVSSVTVYDTVELIALFKGSQLAHPTTSLASPVPQGLTPTQVRKASTPSTSSDHLSTAADAAPVTGIDFLTEASTLSLLVSTDKHLVCLPLEVDTPSSARRKKKTSTWDERSVRRLEFGTPTKMSRDPVTGLLLMIMNPTSAEKSKPRGGNPSGIVIMDVKQKREKIFISTPQVYLDHPGSVVSLQAFTEFSKVVSVDDQGCMIIWNVRPDKLKVMQADYIADKRLADTPLNLASTPVNISSPKNSMGDDVFAPKEMTAASALLEEEPIHEKDVVSTPWEESNTGPGSNNGTPLNRVTDDDENDDNDDNDDSDDISYMECDKPDQHEISGLVNFVPVEKGLTDDEEAQLFKETHASYDTAIDETLKEIAVQSSTSISALAQHYALRPYLCHKQRKLLLTDGCFITVKSLDGSSDVLLGQPLDLSMTFNHVVATTISPSGEMVAAIVSTGDNGSTSKSALFSLVVWTRDRDTNTWPVSICLGLNSSNSSKSSISMDWLADGSLVLAVPTGGDQVTLARLAAADISPTFQPETLHASSKVATIQGPLRAIRAIPGIVYCPSNTTPSKTTLALWSDSKIQLFHLSDSRGSPEALEHVWSDDAGPRGPYIAMDVVETKTKKLGRCSSMIAALDSFGGVKIVLVYENGTPRSSYAKVAAAHVSGASKVISLSSYKESNELQPACFLASSCSVRMFSVTVSALSDKPLTVKLVLMSKVLINFSPEYLLPFLKESSIIEKERRPDILVADREGNLAFVQFEGVDPPEFLQLNSAPLTRIPSAVTVCLAAEIVAMINHKGQLVLYHTSSGIKMPSLNSLGSLTATCLASTDSLLAVGSRCGRVSLYNALTSQLLRSFSHPSSSSSAVVSLLFINDDNAVVAVFDDGSVVVYAVEGSQATKLPKLAHTDDATPISLVRCDGDSDIFGMVRGLEIELVQVKLSNSAPLQVIGVAALPVEEGEHPTSLKIDQTLVPTATTLFKSSLVFMESPWYNDHSSVPHTLDQLNDNGTQVAGNNNIQLSSMHMIKESDAFHFVAVGATKKGGAFVSFLYSGSLDIQYSSNSEHDSISLYQKVKLGSSFCTCHFKETKCAVSLSEGIFVLDLAALLVSPSCGAKVVPLTIDEFKGAAQVLVTAKASAVGGTSWSGSVLNLQSLVSSSSSQYTTSLFVCKNHKPGLLLIKCS